MLSGESKSISVISNEADWRNCIAERRESAMDSTGLTFASGVTDAYPQQLRSHSWLRFFIYSNTPY
jgi:hypothetical protein